MWLGFPGLTQSLGPHYGATKFCWGLSAGVLRCKGNVFFILGLSDSGLFSFLAKVLSYTSVNCR